MLPLMLALLGCGSSHDDPPDPGPAVTQPGPRAGKAPPAPNAPRPGGAAQSGGAAASKGTGLAFNNADSVCRTADGDAHALYAQDGALVYRHTGDEAVSLAQSDVSLMCLATDQRETLLAAWSAGRPPRVSVSWSQDGGASWSQARPLPEAMGTGPSSRVWREGKGELRALVAWHTPEGGKGGPSTPHVRASTWSKGKWSKAQTLDASAKGASWVALAPMGDKTLAMWKEKTGQAHEHTLAMSTYDGAAWSAPRGLGLTGQDPGICVSDSGRIHMGYHDKATAWRTWSDDGGASWQEPERLDAGFFVQAECSGDTVVFLFERLLQRGDMKDPMLKTFAVYRSNNDGETLKVVKTPGEAGQVRPSALLHPDGRVELRYVDASTGTRTMGTLEIPAK